MHFFAFSSWGLVKVDILCNDAQVLCRCDGLPMPISGVRTIQASITPTPASWAHHRSNHAAPFDIRILVSFDTGIGIDTGSHQSVLHIMQCHWRLSSISLMAFADIQNVARDFSASHLKVVTSLTPFCLNTSSFFNLAGESSLSPSGCTIGRSSGGPK